MENWRKHIIALRQIIKHISGIREVTKENYEKGIKTACLFAVKLKEKCNAYLCVIFNLFLDY